MQLPLVQPGSRGRLAPPLLSPGGHAILLIREVAVAQKTRPLAERCHMVMGGRRVDYTIRRNSRAKRIWIKIDEHEGLVLVLPRWGRAVDAADHIRRHREWVLEHLIKWEERVASAPPPLGTGRTVVYRGRPIPLKVRNCACTEPTVEWHRNHLLVHLPRDTQPVLADILRQSFRAKAKEIFLRRVEALAEDVRVKPKRVFIRDQKTRWGACTTLGTVTFNWRLVLAPPSVLDYVVIHELCHLRHPNHGRRFWELVESVCPNFDAHRAWLRENGALLRVS